MERIPESRYEDLVDFAKDGERYRDPAFWEASGRITGISERMRESWSRVGLIQVHRRYKRVSLQDAAATGNMLIKQGAFSLLALIETPICNLLGCSCHPAARRSLEYYCMIYRQSNVLCDTKGETMCPI